MVVLHHLKDSRAQRILWLLEELGIPYEIKNYSRLPDGRSPPELRTENPSPLGKSPTITDTHVIDSKEETITLVESGAICEYLITKYDTKGKFVVSQRLSQAWIDNAFYTHFAEEFARAVVLAYVLKRQGATDEEGAHKVEDVFTMPVMKKYTEMIEQHLAKTGSNWFAGQSDPTSADFMMIVPLENLILRYPNLAGPSIREYVKRAQARTSYRQGVEKVGGYSLILKDA
ncbi:glutathione s-transferase [Moniliophthora roreri MCA 2997]|uniref:Glutathione s-transferase n=1 Tax=Moniliophthora roreri (strain MCA 2997) TaxID=1381753 RepID=V2WQ21_MONRO|nr:glutathione s-transferase [Moniliophthora roreri MCA 2997]